MTNGTEASALTPTDATVLRLINEYRGSNGLAPLAEDPQLSAVSADWSRSMSAAGRLSHNPQAAAQYGRPVTGSGEIVGYAAAPQSSDDQLAAVVVQGWIDSPGHRNVMLGADWNRIGIGSTRSADGRLYATGNFVVGANQAAAPPPPPAAPATGVSAAGAEALALSREIMADGASPRVVISRDDVAVDALAASGLSGPDSPILFVAEGRPLAPEIVEEIRRVSSPDTRVYLMGGGIDGAAERQVAAVGPTPVRLAGSSRYETALFAAREIMAVRGQPSRIHLVRADEWADAVSIGGRSAAYGCPVMLLDRDGVPPATAEVLDANPDADRLVVGGSAAISDSTVQFIGARRLSGADRSETGANVMRRQWAQASGVARHLVIAPGWAEDGWATALAHSPYAARFEAPLLFAGDGGTPEPVRAVLAEQGYTPDTAPTVRFARGVGDGVRSEILALTAN